MPCLIVLPAVLLMVGCGSVSRQPDSNGRVNGHALAGPTCPVEQPGDPDCRPVPVQGIVQFEQGDNVVTSVQINDSGGFAAEIPAGSYTVTVDTGDNPFPVCPPVEVDVRADVDAVVEISCDTGIR
jgi:hypothetical protein